MTAAAFGADAAWPPVCAAAGAVAMRSCDIAGAGAPTGSEVAVTGVDAAGELAAALGVLAADSLSDAVPAVVFDDDASK